MACGMYYKVEQPKPPVKKFGHEKRNENEVAAIVRRLQQQQPQNSTESKSAAMPMYSLSSSLSMPQQQQQNLPLQSSSSSNNLKSLFYRKVKAVQLAQRLLPSKVDLANENIDKIFQRLSQGNTKSWQVHLTTTQLNNNSQNNNKDSAAAVDSVNKVRHFNRPKTAAVGYKNNKNNNELFNLQFQIRTKELELIKTKRLERICKHTSVSKQKQRGVCAFCEESKARQQQLHEEEIVKKQSGRWTLADEEEKDKKLQIILHGFNKEEEMKFNSLKEEEEHIRRMQIPTNASQGGLPICEKTIQDKLLINNQYFIYGKRDLPLISGLNRTSNTKDIFERLSRPKSSIY